VRREAEGSPPYWAWLYSPPRLRAVLQALLAIEGEIRAALRPGLDHHVAHVRLEWWREECARCARGTPAHPLTRGLLAAYSAAAPDAARSDPARAPAGPVDPEGLIDTAQWDLAAATFATRAELTGYCDRWASATTQIAAENAAEFGRSLGRALKEIALLADLAPDARRGLLRLPLDELEQAGVEPSALGRPPWPAALCALLGSRHRQLREALAASVATLSPAAQPPLRGLIVWAAVAHRQSLRAERALPHAWQASGANRLADAYLAWRTARRADRGKFALQPEARP
jgi:15-cis-phytoene synthase